MRMIIIVLIISRRIRIYSGKWAVLRRPITMYTMIHSMPRTGISVYKLTLPESSSCGGVNVALLVTFKKRSKSFDCRLLVVISIPLKSL